jgi:hypothetical protein
MLHSCMGQAGRAVAAAFGQQHKPKWMVVEATLKATSKQHKYS